MHRAKIALVGAVPIPFCWKHGWVGICRENLMRNCFNGTERSGTPGAAASQVGRPRGGISLWRLLFAYTKVIFFRGNDRNVQFQSRKYHCLSNTRSWGGTEWDGRLLNPTCPSPWLTCGWRVCRRLSSAQLLTTHPDGRTICKTEIENVGHYPLKLRLLHFFYCNLTKCLEVLVRFRPEGCQEQP